VDAQLLETHAPGRYRLHDLLRLYARERARQRHPEPARAAALTRALGFYVATAWQTLECLRPGDYRLDRADDRWRKGGLKFADEQAALGWLEAERANLLAAVQQAAATPGVPTEIALQLAQALFGFYWVRSHWDDRVRVNQTALGVARRVGDLAAQAQALNDLGGAYWRQGRYEEALACRRRSLAIYRELGDGHGQAASLGNLGLVYQGLGRDEEALSHHGEALTLCRELGDRRGQAISLGNLGAIHVRGGRFDEALACQRESLAIYRELGDRDGEADCLIDLGVAHGRQGQFAEALAVLRESLAVRRELCDHHGQANSLRELGVILRKLGRLEEARAHWLAALGTFERLRTSDAGRVRALLAELPGRPR
jgi:tetratricopeptide (TPR) repeat protein